MNKLELYDIQAAIEALLSSEGPMPLAILAKDNCSEASRLVGYWALKNIAGRKAIILQGTLLSGRRHDIVAIVENEKIYLIDPTIWQMDVDSENIFLGQFESLTGAVNFARQKYGGEWSEAEHLSITDSDIEMAHCEEVIKKNIKN